jgi:gliding motility-associated-like protein
LWKFGDGNTTTVQDPTHIYAAPGVYTVTLVVTDSIGCTDSIVKTNHITILQPRADFVMSDSVTLCLPFQVNFFNTSFGWRFLNWDFGGVTSFLENPSRTYAAPGTYDVKLYAIGYGGCLDSITKRIVVYDTTGMRVTYNPLNGCSPQNVNFSINAPGPVRYTWDFDDGQTLDTIASSITHTYADYGSFQPKVIVRDPSGCNIPVIGPTNILITGARANFGVDRKLFCDSGTVNFIDSTTFNAPVTNYSWNFGDGFTSALQQPSHLYATPGLYTVTLTVTTQGGCTSVKTIPDLVKVVASPRAAITGDTAGCPGARLQLAASLLVPDTSAITWLWNINGQNFSGTTPPIQQFVTPGNYPATLIAVNSTGCADTVSQNLTVYPIPTSTVTTPIVIPAGSSILIPITYSAGVNIFNWAPSNTLDCNTCPNPVATPKGSTTYRVNYTDNNGCRNSDTVRIEVLCSDKNIYIPNTFSPNGDGVNDIFFPRGKGVDRVRSMVIFNRWGNIVYERIGFIPNDPSSGWNGRYKNVTANPDVYTYIIEVICDNNQIIKYRGNISLIR